MCGGLFSRARTDSALGARGPRYPPDWGRPDFDRIINLCQTLWERKQLRFPGLRFSRRQKADSIQCCETGESGNSQRPPRYNMSSTRGDRRPLTYRVRANHPIDKTCPCRHLPSNGPLLRHCLCEPKASAPGQSGDREPLNLGTFAEPPRNHKMSGRYLDRRRTAEGPSQRRIWKYQKSNMNDIEEESNSHRGPFRERVRDICNSLYSLGLSRGLFSPFEGLPGMAGSCSPCLMAVLSHQCRHLFLQTAISIGRVDGGTFDKFSALGPGDGPVVRAKHVRLLLQRFAFLIRAQYLRAPGRSRPGSRGVSNVRTTGL